MPASSPRLTSAGKYVINVLLAALVFTVLSWLPSFDFKWLIGLLAVAFLATSVATRGIVLPKLSVKPKSNQKQHAGNVKWFNGTKGFGFITGDDGDEVFVHFRHVEGLSKRDIKPGQRVSYQVVGSDRGPQAEHVKPL